ncbi:MAG: hypothetical protein IKH21_09520 [Clostridia bacterium]|nr:hypothetical protein [Clostridia bacterium]
MSKNINTFAAGLLALTSIAAASVGCQPQASEQTAANPTEFVEQTETVDATETEAASTFELTEEPTEEPTAEPVETPADPTEEPTAEPARVLAKAGKYQLLETPDGSQVVSKGTIICSLPRLRSNEVTLFEIESYPNETYIQGRYSDGLFFWGYVKMGKEVFFDGIVEFRSTTDGSRMYLIEKQKLIVYMWGNEYYEKTFKAEIAFEGTDLLVGGRLVSIPPIDTMKKIKI